MDSRVRRPRLLAVLRTFLYLSATFAAVVLLSVAASFLGLLTLLGLVSLLMVGEVSELVVLVVGGLGLVAFGSVGLLLATVTRRIDRYLVRTARIPSPLERVTASYLAGDIDERELERGIERALLAEDATERGRHRTVSHEYATGPVQQTRAIEVELEWERT